MADDACSPRTKTRAIRSDENYMICNGGGRGMGADVHTIAAAGCSDGKACLLRFPWGPAWDQGCHAWWALGDGIAMKRTCMPPQTCHGIGPYKPIPSSLSLHILRRSSEFRYILCIQRISLHILHPANFATHSASSEFRYTCCAKCVSPCLCSSNHA